MAEERVLNMVLRKEFAEQIVRGEKVREYRAFSPFWIKRLGLCEDPADKFHVTGAQAYDRVHFYPYNNKWFLDCQIMSIELIRVNQYFIDNYSNECEAPLGAYLWVIHLDGVIDTNLSVE